MKKFISVLMCAMLVISMCTIANAAADDLTVVAKVGGNEATTVAIDEIVVFTVSVKNVANADSAYIALDFTEDFEMVENSAKWTSAVASGAALLSDYDSMTKDGTLGHNAAIDMNGEIYSFQLKAKTPTATAKDVSVMVVLSEIGAGTLLNETKVTSITITNKPFSGAANVKLEGVTEVTYDGSAHGLTLTNVPTVAGVTSKVTYLAQGEASPSEEAPVNAGTYTVTGTVEATDYATITRTATLVIKPKEVTALGLAAEDKTYDGTTAATLKTDAITLNGVIGADFVTVDASSLADAAFADANVGTGKVVTYTGELALTGTDAANYVLKTKTPEVKAEIKALDVTVNDGDVSISYDANSNPKFEVSGEEIDMSKSEYTVDTSSGSPVIVFTDISFKGGNHNVSLGSSSIAVGISAADLCTLTLAPAVGGTYIVNGVASTGSVTLVKGTTIEIEVSTSNKYKFVSVTMTPDDATKVVDGTKVTFEAKNDVTIAASFKKKPSQGVIGANQVAGSTVKSNKIVLTIGEKTATVFGEKVENDVAPVIVNDRTMLPIRFIAEALGARVEWEDETDRVSIMKDMKLIDIYIGSSTAYINEEPIELDAPAFIQDSRTFLPLRFIAETLGANVQWNDITRQVIITK